MTTAEQADETGMPAMPERYATRAQMSGLARDTLAQCGVFYPDDQTPVEALYSQGLDGMPAIMAARDEVQSLARLSVATEVMKER